MAADLFLGPIQVASDCLEVINGLQGEHLGIFGSILKEIKERSDQRRNTFFGHERRESNDEAHRLACFATSLPAGRHVCLLEPPNGLNMPVTVNSV